MFTQAAPDSLLSRFVFPFTSPIWRPLLLGFIATQTASILRYWHSNIVTGLLTACAAAILTLALVRGV